MKNLDKWITQEAITLSTGSSATFRDSIKNFIPKISKSVELLGFGEALHGGEDILALRNMLFQHLVEDCGYSAIAIESSFPRAHAVNDLVAGCGPQSYESIQDTGFSHGFGKIKQNRVLVQWIRQYNADSSHHIKIHFYGFDSPTEMVGSDSPSHVLHFVLDYLDSIDIRKSQEFRHRIDSLLGPDEHWEDPATSFDPAKGIGLSPNASTLRVETEELITELQVRRPELVAKSDGGRYLEAMQYLCIARQLLNYHAALARPSKDRFVRLLAIRDAIMAENLAYIVGREQGRGKVLVFAHNQHLKRGRAEWQFGPDLHTWWPAGSHLHEMMGSRYAVIGTGVGISSENGIGQPEVGTLEARLTSFPGTTRILPTYGGKGIPMREINELPIRSASKKNTTYFPLTPLNFTDFDWLAVLNSTTYSLGGPPITVKF